MVERVLCELFGEIVLNEPRSRQPRIVRPGVAAGLELLDLILNPDHVVRITEDLSFAGAQTLRRRFRVDVMLDRVSSHREAGASQMAALLSERVASGHPAHAARLWTPLVQVPRPLVVPIDVHDSDSELLPRPPQREIRTLLEAALYHLLRESLHVDPDFEREDSPLGRLMRTADVARWTLQAAMLAVCESSPASPRSHQRLERLLDVAGCTDLDQVDHATLAAVVERQADEDKKLALAVLHHKVSRLPALLELVELIHANYIIIAGLDPARRDHSVRFALPDVEASPSSPDRRLVHQVQQMLDPRDHNVTARIRLRVPAGVEQYRVQLTGSVGADGESETAMAVVAAVTLRPRPAAHHLAAVDSCRQRLRHDLARLVARAAEPVPAVPVPGGLPDTVPGGGASGGLPAAGPGGGEPGGLPAGAGPGGGEPGDALAGGTPDGSRPASGSGHHTTLNYEATEARAALEALRSLANQQRSLIGDLETRWTRVSSRLFVWQMRELEASAEALKDAAAAAIERADALVALTSPLSAPLPAPGGRGHGDDGAVAARGQALVAALDDVLAAAADPRVDLHLTGDDAPGQDLGRARANRPLLDGAPQSEAEAMDVWVTMSDEAMSFPAGVVFPPIALFVFFWLFGALLFESVAWMYSYSLAAGVEAGVLNREADALAAVLLLLPGIALALSRWPKSSSVRTRLRRPVRSQVYTAVGLLSLCAVVVAIRAGGDQTQHGDLLLILRVLRGASWIFLAWVVWSLCAWALRGTFVWMPKGLSRDIAARRRDGPGGDGPRGTGPEDRSCVGLVRRTGDRALRWFFGVGKRPDVELVVADVGHAVPRHLRGGLGGRPD